MARAHRQSVGQAEGAPPLNPHTRVGELLAQRPRAAMVFIRQGMACAGCELNAFDTLAGAARCYGLPVDELIARLEAIETQPPAAAGQNPGTNR